MPFHYLIAKLLLPGFVFIVIFCSCFVGRVQAGSSVEHDFQLWTPVYITFPIHNKVKGYFEVNPRVGDDATNMNQLLIRPALGCQLTKNLSLWQGYAWVTNYQPTFRDEHRLYQQLLYNKSFANLKLMSRSRLEERFIEETDGTAVRARTMLRGNIPLGDANRWSFVLYDEIFVNLNSLQNGPEAGFDQNRVFAGFNQKVHENLNIDIGYQLQLINTRASRFVDVMNHILLVQVFIDW